MEFVVDPLTNPDLVTQVRIDTIGINRLSMRKRGMASNTIFIIPDFFFLHFPMNFVMATLGLKEIKKILWEGGEKVCP